MEKRSKFIVTINISEIKKYEKYQQIFAKPIDKIKKIREKWSVATPYQKLMLFYNFGLHVEDVIQVRVLSKKPIGILGYVPAITCISHYILLLYTIYYYVSRRNCAGCLPSFCILGLISSVGPICEKFPYKQF